MNASNGFRCQFDDENVAWNRVLFKKFIRAKVGIRVFAMEMATIFEFITGNNSAIDMVNKTCDIFNLYT